jgi:hypothetical protein
MRASGARIPMICRTAVISVTWPFPPPLADCPNPSACSALDLSVFHWLDAALSRGQGRGVRK